MRALYAHVPLIIVGVALGNSVQPTHASAQESVIVPAKVTLIRRVLELTKAGELAMTSIRAAVSAQRASNPQVPAEFWDELTRRANQEAPKFVDALVPIYDSLFSVVQLQGLVRFYQSPLGQHIVEVQPTIAAQSIRAGQRWGSQLGSQIAQDLARRGVQVPRRP